MSTLSLEAVNKLQTTAKQTNSQRPDHVWGIANHKGATWKMIKQRARDLVGNRTPMLEGLVAENAVKEAAKQRVKLFRDWLECMPEPPQVTAGAAQPQEAEADAAQAVTPSKEQAAGHMSGNAVAYSTPTPEKPLRRHSCKGPPKGGGMSIGTASTDVIAPQASPPQNDTATLPAGLPGFQKALDDIGRDSESDFPEPEHVPDGHGKVVGSLEDGKWAAGFPSLGMLTPPRDTRERAQKDLEYVEQATSESDAVKRIDKLFEVRDTVRAAKQAWQERGARVLSGAAGSASHDPAAGNKTSRSKRGESLDYPDAVWASVRAFGQGIESGPVSPEVAALAAAADHQIEEADSTK
jgi:hypothetical protein